MKRKMTQGINTTRRCRYATTHNRANLEDAFGRSPHFVFLCSLMSVCASSFGCWQGDGYYEDIFQNRTEIVRFDPLLAQDLLAFSPSLLNVCLLSAPFCSLFAHLEPLLLTFSPLLAHLLAECWWKWPRRRLQCGSPPCSASRAPRRTVPGGVRLSNMLSVHFPCDGSALLTINC